MVVKLTKADRAYRQLRQHLEWGTFQRGERLTEAKVAQVLKMGRGPVRESMVRLEAEGLLRGKGAFAGKFVEFVEAHSCDELIWRYQLRLIVDGLAARLAAENMTGREIVRLQALDRDVYVQIATGNRAGRAQASKNFHDFLLKTCGNPLLIRVADMFDLHPVVGRNPDLDEKLLSSVSGPDCDESTWYTPAVQAIATHAPEEAQRRMQTWIHRFIAALRESADSDDLESI